MTRQRIQYPLILAVVLLSGKTAWTTSSSWSLLPGSTRPEETELPYDLKTPDTIIYLDKSLTEISGLTWLGDNRLGAVNDEKGRLYVLDALTGSIVDVIHFDGSGDYEGLEAVDQKVYVIRSDGVLFDFATDSDRTEANKTRTGLKKSCDAEGLAYERPSNSLLIACKEYPGKGLKGKKAIHRFMLSSAELETRPALVINALDDSLTPPEGYLNRSIRKLFKIPRFKPSGVAVNPLDGLLYILSSRSHGLTVFTPDGRLVSSSFLRADLFPQAEGITFAPDGTLYLSSEGRGGAGRLVRYEYRPSMN